MKKSKIVVLFILGFVLGALAAVGVYFLTVGEVAWQEYVETKLIPNAVRPLGYLGVMCCGASYYKQNSSLCRQIQPGYERCKRYGRKRQKDRRETRRARPKNRSLLGALR